MRNVPIFMAFAVLSICAPFSMTISCWAGGSIPEYNKRKFCESVATVHQSGGSSYVDAKYLNPCLQTEEKGYFQAKTLWDGATESKRTACDKSSRAKNANYGDGSYFDLAKCLQGK